MGTNISKDFTHPYPDVQASTAYDEDFVKDENSDNGEWKAQADYDLLRAKKRKEENDVKEAEGKKAEKEKEKDVLKKAEEKLKDAQDKETESKKHVEGAV